MLATNKNYKVCISTSSAESTLLGVNSIDYIFTDHPPFGGNLMYSELNYLWEAWLKVFTNNKPEAIENSFQGKGIREYQQLMERCFNEYYKVLKPGRWMTVVFIIHKIESGMQYKKQSTELALWLQTLEF